MYLMHSMARANLNKREVFLTNTNAISKSLPKRPRICINWNSLFQTQIYLVKIPLNVNIVKQDLLHEKNNSGNFMKGFQSMPILSCLGMYFDNAEVFVKKTKLLIRLAPAILCINTYTTLVLTDIEQRINGILWIF